ncbi:hypothetical protein NPIL_559411 [Nephila pilipes]|uniref:Uncharacterized protein n=1 Tax=Nephila pilipes TaxID=299642 RepID=A0A8X6PPK1_NEPPI|nr:hypothetical protein NPIL_435171 [Nephila pilipes]GFT77844.1 hypothetical protein NPIL_559411 [Nephila pilipes]
MDAIFSENILKENRTVRSVNHPAPASYAEGTRKSLGPFLLQKATTSFTNIFDQLKDPDVIDMFNVLKSFLKVQNHTSKIQ